MADGSTNTIYQLPPIIHASGQFRVLILWIVMRKKIGGLI